MRFVVLALVILALSVGCKKEKWFGGPNSMTEDFESYAHVDSMFSYDDVRWSFNQNTVDGNYLSFDTNIVHSGNKSLRFYAHASPADFVSKNSIVKQHMAFYEGDVVRISAWYYVEGTESKDWIFLFDFEEQSAIGAGPGIRLASTEANGVVLEHKFFETDIYQTAGQEIIIPRNQWFNLTMEVLLSQKSKGYVKVWQDNQLIIDGTNTKTLPKDFLYWQQGTKGMYQSIEFGITANTKESETVLYMDDISVYKIN
jgi:hypothetical protein